MQKGIKGSRIGMKGDNTVLLSIAIYKNIMYNKGALKSFYNHKKKVSTDSVSYF